MISDNGVLGGLVGEKSFNSTFNTPSPTIIGLIVAIYEGWSPIHASPHEVLTNKRSGLFPRICRNVYLR